MFSRGFYETSIIISFVIVQYFNSTIRMYTQRCYSFNKTRLQATTVANKVTFTAYDKDGNFLHFKTLLQPNPTPEISYQSTHNEICTRQRFTEEFLMQDGIMQLIVSLAIEFPTQQPDMHTFAVSLQKGKPIKYYDPTKNAWTSANIKRLQETAQANFNELRKQEKFQTDFPPLHENTQH